MLPAWLIMEKSFHSTGAETRNVEKPSKRKQMSMFLESPKRILKQIKSALIVENQPSTLL